MKLSTVLSFALTCTASQSSAFVFPHQCQSSSTTSITRLEATSSKTRLWKPALSGGMMGWVLATKIATASSNPQDMTPPTEYIPLQEAYPTTIIAEGAYTPEAGYESLNMDMPNYSIKREAKFKSDGTGQEEVVDDKKSTAQSKAKTKSLAEIEKNKAKVKAEKEEANIRQYVETQQKRSKEKADKERIKAKIDEERLAAKEAQIADRAAREKRNGQ